jgi:hypothetical protein
MVEKVIGYFLEGYIPEILSITVLFKLALL